jgi:hypothetical protein
MISTLQLASGDFEILGIRKEKIPLQLLRILRQIRKKSNQVKALIKNATLRAIVQTFPSIFSRLVITNSTSTKKDGTGAQIQRLLATAALAERLKIPFLQSRILDVAIHPLDGFQDHDSYNKFIEKLNYLFMITSTNRELDIDGIRRVKNLELNQLIKIAVRSHRTKQFIRIEVENPYPLSDLNVNQYPSVIRKLENLSQVLLQKPTHPYIAIHYRQGVGNFAVYPGQTIPREITLDYFKSRINNLVSEADRARLELHVFTDAPTSVIKFQPPSDQMHLWEGSPGYVDGIMTVQPQAFSPDDFGVSKVVVHSGGDPIDAMIQMARASVLIVGRSSLSYIAGILNKDGTVVGPPEFWHPSLETWK